MGTVPTPVSGVRLADASRVFLGTIAVANTRRGYAVVLDRFMRDFGTDGNVALLDPDLVAGWFTFVWGGAAATTFNVRLAALRLACAYWREQGWLIGDPLVRLRARPAPPDTGTLRPNDVVHVDPAQVPSVEDLYVALSRAKQGITLVVPANGGLGPWLTTV